MHASSLFVFIYRSNFKRRIINSIAVDVYFISNASNKYKVDRIESGLYFLQFVASRYWIYFIRACNIKVGTNTSNWRCIQMEGFQTDSIPNIEPIHPFAYDLVSVLFVFHKVGSGFACWRNVWNAIKLMVCIQKHEGTHILIHVEQNLEWCHAN